MANLLARTGSNFRVPSIAQSAGNALEMQRQSIANDMAEKRLGAFDEDRAVKQSLQGIQTEAAAITMALKGGDSKQASEIYKRLGGKSEKGISIVGKDVSIDYGGKTFSGPRDAVSELMENVAEKPEWLSDPKTMSWATKRGISSKTSATAIAKNKGKDKHPLMADLMAKGWMPSTRVTGPMMDAFEGAAARAQELGKPLTVQDLRTMEFQAVKNRSTGSTAGGRMVLARKQNIVAGMKLIKKMKKTAAKIDFSKIRMKGAYQKWQKGQLNDPILGELMTQRADALFVLTAAMKMTGATDKSIEVEQETFPVESSQEYFAAWYNSQMSALNEAAIEMNKDYKFGIELEPVFDAGQGGAPTKEQPYPVMPQEGGHGAPKYEDGARAVGPNGEPIVFRNGGWEDL